MRPQMVYSITKVTRRRLIKAKAKADRAASRREAKDSPATATSTPHPTSTTSGTDPTEAGAATEPTSETPRDDQAEALQTPAKDQILDRNELLRSKPEVVGRFMQLMVPVLIDVYAASVITSVRLKTLTGLLKAVGFLEIDDLRRVFSVGALHPLPNKFSTSFVPSSFRLPVSLL